MTEFIPLKDAHIESGPPGNRIYLVCSACPDTDDAIMLGKRTEAEYHRCPSATDLRDWFERHAKCDGGPDKFRLAYGRVPNWEYQLVATPHHLAVVK